MTSTLKPTLSDYLAAERTFLAWIRTGLALMGFGFVVARFGLFLQQIEFLQHAAAAPSYGLSLWFGTALIFTGVVVNIFSAWHHIRLVRELERGEPELSRPSKQAVLIALFLALVGLAMAIYLISVHGSVHPNAVAGAGSSDPPAAAIVPGASIRPTGEIKEDSMAAPAPVNRGIITKPSNHSVDETVAKLKSILEARGVMLFALVDHSGEAAKVGLQMPNTKLLIFGSPKAGTPLMLASPSIAIDLPLKILVSEDAQGKVWVSYNSSEYLRDRHALPQDLLANIAVVETLATKAAE